MTNKEKEKVILAQRAYFKSGKTLSVGMRERALKKLYRAIRKYENEILDALREDLGKSRMEGFMCEVGLSLNEISHMLKHLRRYAAPRPAITPITNFAAISMVYREPYGNVLIMSPWNYPFLLTISPLVDAIAAGNTAVVKPSAYSPATSAVIEKMIGETFPKEYVAVILGGREENSYLLSQKYDMIFFTGSQAVGKEVLRAAAPNLTPVTLELGGKSPCIVDGSANIRLAARRIVWGKNLNCGQTCVAPDYIICEEFIRDDLVEAIRKEILRQFGKKPLENPNYGKMINEKHFRRVMKLIDKDKVVIGGEKNEKTLQIAPTLMKDVDWQDAVMQEEIFGPVLPVLTYRDLDELIERLQDMAHPLALYIFSGDKDNIRKCRTHLRYGGGCINDTVVHLATPEIPFGGFGESGMGAYHGKAGFDTFSHKKSIMDKKEWIDLPMRYQPFRKIYEFMLRIVLR